jgi:hypothetical protein
LAADSFTRRRANLMAKFDRFAQGGFGLRPMSGLKFKNAIKRITQGDGARRADAQGLL